VFACDLTFSLAYIASRVNVGLMGRTDPRGSEMKFKLISPHRLNAAVFEGDNLIYRDGVVHVSKDAKVVALIPLEKGEYITAVE
jgi:hypothetical protein